MDFDWKLWTPNLRIGVSCNLNMEYWSFFTEWNAFVMPIADSCRQLNDNNKKISPKWLTHHLKCYGWFCIVSTEHFSMGAYLCDVCVALNRIAPSANVSNSSFYVSWHLPINSAYKTVSIQPNVLYLCVYMISITLLLFSWIHQYFKKRWGLQNDCRENFNRTRVPITFGSENERGIAGSFTKAVVSFVG